MLQKIHTQKTTGSKKSDREKQVLLCLIAQYIETGKPIGSNTLKESVFNHLSSATLRNYFANLEKRGYLTQQHVSGGRLPTQLGYQFYAKQMLNSKEVSPQTADYLEKLRSTPCEKVSGWLQDVAEKLSELTHCAVFYSSPRFEHDYIVKIKIAPIDHSRCVCIFVTNFGLIKTEVMPIKNKLSAFTIKRMEQYFHWCLTGKDAPENIEDSERELAHHFYNELIVRHIVKTSRESETLHQVGFSKLLSYPELHDANELANALRLFEHEQGMHKLIKEGEKRDSLTFWIGDALTPYAPAVPNCSVLMIPYRVHQQCVGTLGILGSMRIPYPKLFATLRAFEDAVSDQLTKNLYRFKIHYSSAKKNPLATQQQMIEESHLFLLEDMRNCS